MKKTHWMGFLGVVLSVSMAGAAMAGEVIDAAKVREFNRLIREKGAQWVAKENALSHLSRAELTRMMGSNEQPEGMLDFEGVQKGAPTSLDWRAKDGINWLGAVLNQGNCGSCVAFATVGTLEAQVTISAGLPWLRPSFSPQQLFGCGGGGCESGWTPSSAASFLQRRGIVDAACSPYTSGSTGEDVSCGTNTCADANARTYKITSSTRVGGYGGSVDAVKAALAKGPMVTTMTVYSDFITYAGGIYRSVGGEALGGHAISLVGYDDASRTWIIRNSWGPSWGEGGFARISWDDRSGIGSSNTQFQVPSQSGYVSVVSPADRDYVSGRQNVSVESSQAGTAQVQVRAADRGSVLMNMSCAMRAGGTCDTAFDTTTLADGHYEVVATGVGQSVFSQIRDFYVINHEPTNLSLSFTGAAVDLTKPVKDRIEFNVKASSDPIPLKTVTFFARNKATGKVAFERVTDIVVDEMKLGFRTNAVPNGVYEIGFHGELPVGAKTYSVASPVVTITIQN